MNGALDFLEGIQSYETKEELIYKEEVYLSERLEGLGLQVGAVFDAPDLMEASGNLTIQQFDALINRGFPFFKSTLLTEAGFKIDDPRIEKILTQDVLQMLSRHLVERANEAGDDAFDRNGMTVPTSHHPGSTNKYGVLKSWNRPECSYGYLQVPLDTDQTALRSPLETKILAVVHCYYVDIGSNLLSKLKALGPDAKIVLTTDTEEKAAQLSTAIDAEGMTATIAVYENRGRDVMPFLRACEKYLGDAEAVLHLHTKKSPHDHQLNDWGDYLTETLVGSEAHIASNLSILHQESVGLVYPAHYKTISERLNWGYNYTKTRGLLQRMGISITADQILDFPSGTMFWARADVIKPLIDIGLQPYDFPEEGGQEDGTLAHAIERSLTYIAEDSGYFSIPVVSKNKAHQAWGRSMSGRQSELPTLIKRLSQFNLRSQRKGSQYYDSVSEIYPIGTIPSRIGRPRFNILIPSLKPEHIFGGISTALKTADEVFNAMGDMDLRFIITSTDVNRASLDMISKRLNCKVVKDRPSGDIKGVSAVSTGSDRYDAVSIRANDYFFATAWWTADLGYRLIKDQRASFGAAPKLIYLIQDYEPGFYQWSDKFANAEATYANGSDTLAIINSEELANFMTDRYEFPDAVCVPFEINASIASNLESVPKQKKIFVYGRPSTARNCFGSIVEGLRLWQSRDPEANTDWHIVFAGETFSPQLIEELDNAVCVGKLSLKDYASLLSEAGIGISLMLSPHPSYPPLELAMAGALTITNDYDYKKMGVRSQNITSLKSVTPLSIADALDHAIGQSKINETVPLSEINRPASNVPTFDAKTIAEKLLAEKH